MTAGCRMAGVALGVTGVVKLKFGTPVTGAMAVRALPGPVAGGGIMAAGAVIIAAMREGCFSPAVGCVAVGALVVVVIFVGRWMEAQSIMTGAIVAETGLAPVAGVVTGGTLPNIVPGRCRVAGAAIRQVRMAEIDIPPPHCVVAFRALPGIVICRTLVAGFAVHVGAVVHRTCPLFSIVTLRTGTRFMLVRRGVAGETIR